MLGIILDDFHVIENRDILDRLNLLFSRKSSVVHYLILSRTFPPLTLGRMRAYGNVRHLTEVDLRFTADEIAQLDQRAHLSRDDVHALTTRTEGWITGVRMALSSIDETRASGEYTPRALAIPSQQRWLDDYLVEEV